MTIAAGEFKEKCLKLMDHVKKYHEEIVITKHGKPIAKMVAIDDEEYIPLLGYMKDTVKIIGDIMEPIDEKWDAQG